MVLHTINELLERARSLEHPRHVAVAAAENDHVIEAVLKAERDGFAVPWLVGRAEQIKVLVEQHGGSLPEERYVDVPSNDPNEIAQETVRLVREGKAQLILKGLLNTSELLRAVLNKETGLPHNDLVTSFSLNEINGIPKLVVFNDAGITPYPTLEQKVTQIKLVTRALRDMGYDEDINVAVVCAAESPNPKIPESMDAVKLKELCAAGEFPHCNVEGPISLDLALLPGSAKEKGYSSPVAGNADVILFPNLVSGNIAAKMLLITGCGMGIAMAIGAGVPIAMTSRSNTSHAKYCALAMAALAAKEA